MIQLSKKELKARLNADSEPMPIDTTSSQTIAKPNVGCCTSMNELIQWCIINAFNIEGQDGTKYIAIDYEEMKDQFDYLLEKERKQMIDFHIGVMKDGLIHEGEKKWKDGYQPKSKEIAEIHYYQNYNGVNVQQPTQGLAAGGEFMTVRTEQMINRITKLKNKNK